MDTSSGGFEEAYLKSGPENDGKYFEGYLEKKDKSKWAKYWCVLKHQNMYFFRDVNTQIKENYVGYCKIDPGMHVELMKPKKEKYEFGIKAEKGKIMLRTDVAFLRNCWLESLNMSIRHDPPSTGSHILPGSGPVSPTRVACPVSPAQAPSPPPPAVAQQTRKPSLPYSPMTEDQLKSLQDVDAFLHGQDTCSREHVQLELDRLNANNNWYLGQKRREETEEILQREVKGTFIVRDYIDNRTNANRGYVISLKDEIDRIRHHRIEKRGASLVLKGYEARSFETLHLLLEFFIMSQKRKLSLLPYDPSNTPVTRPLPPQPDTFGYLPINGSAPSSRHRHAPAGRSLSFQHRRLPEIPPSEPMTHSASVRGHRLPLNPVQAHTHQLNDVTETTPYEDMNQNAATSITTDSYISCSCVPAESPSYVNVAAVSPVPVAPENPYINTTVILEDEPFPPILPPKKRAASLPTLPPYVNLPQGRYPPSNISGINERPYLNMQ